MNKLYIFLIHLFSSIILLYISGSVVFKKQIPIIIGYLIGILALFMFGYSIYQYIKPENYQTSYDRRIRYYRDERRHQPSIDEILDQRE